MRQEPVELEGEGLPGDVAVIIDLTEGQPALGVAPLIEEGAEVVYDTGYERERKERARVQAVVAAAPPMERVATYLRERGYEPLRVWRINGPKGAGGGELAGWLLQTLGMVVVAHQYPSGRYVIYERAEDI